MTDNIIDSFLLNHFYKTQEPPKVLMGLRVFRGSYENFAKFILGLNKGNNFAYKGFSNGIIWLK